MPGRNPEHFVTNMFELISSELSLHNSSVNSKNVKIRRLLLHFKDNGSTESCNNSKLQQIQEMSGDREMVFELSLPMQVVCVENDPTDSYESPLPIQARCVDNDSCRIMSA